MSEAVKSIIQQAQKEGLNYLTATHDIKNIHSGHVMKKAGMHYCYSYKEHWMPKNIHSGHVMKKSGMHYCYSYKEHWMPKNIPVIFRMYQINLDGKKRIYQKYWNQYEHFIEENI